MTVERESNFRSLPVTGRLPTRVQARKNRKKSGVCEIPIESIQNVSKRQKESIRKRYERIGGSLQLQSYSHPMFQAVALGDYEKCKTLLQEFKDVNIRDKGIGPSPLHLAVIHENPAILKLLLENGADYNIQDDNEQAPIHCAVSKNRIHNVAILLECSDLDVNIQNKSLDTPFHIMVREGRYEMCKLALQRSDLKINAKNRKGMTPLHFAAQENHVNVMQLLLDNGGEWNLKDHSSFLPLHYAANKGHVEACKILINYNDGINKQKQLKTSIKDGKTPLMLAAKQGHHQCCTLMECQNINVKDREGNTALHYATINGFEMTVSVLLQMGANPNTINKKGLSPVHEASMKKKEGCLQALVQKEADLSVVDNQGKTVCHYAADKNASESLKLLLTFDTVLELVDVKDASDCAPLHVAIKKDAVDCAMLLLKKGGASSSTVSVDGMTPLHLAAGTGYTRLCEALLSKRDVNINQENDKKVTPLHLAALQGSADVIQMLIRKGAKVSVADFKGRTPLHFAASEGSANALKTLCKRGTPLRAKDDSGSCALHLAASMGSLPCCQILVTQAKATCFEVDRNGNMPLDRAFKTSNDIKQSSTCITKHDLVFQYLLQHMAFNEKKEELMLRIHSYMEKAILEKRRIIIEAIVNSDWWYAGVSGENGHLCYNFHTLIDDYPDLAQKLLDLCVTRSHSEVTYDFRLLEDHYYMPSDNVGATKSVFDSSTQSINLDAIAYTDDSLRWKEDHPLTHMISNRRLQMLQHPLTKEWLLYKYSSYLFFVAILFLLFEFCFTAFLTFYMGVMENWNHIELACKNENFTVKRFCQSLKVSDVCNMDDESLDKRNYSQSVKWGAWTSLLILTVMILLKELYFMWRLRKQYLCYGEHKLRVIRLTFTIAALVTTDCGFSHMVLEVSNWQCGIIALLMTWIHTLSALNQIPPLSAFMPVTGRFLRSFLKVLVYILLLVFVFAFIFHLLLPNQKAFSTIEEAMVKTTVWMLQDLAYDNTFIFNDDTPLQYPTMIKCLFLAFVAFLGGFIVNFFITLPSDQLELFREQSCFHSAAVRAELFFKLDICFPCFRRDKAKGKWTVDEKKRDRFRDFVRMLLGLDSQEENKPLSQLDILQREMEKQNEQITQLVAMNTKQIEDLCELRHQVNMMTNSLIK